MGYSEFMRLLGRSKEYRMDGPVLTIIDYHTGDRIALDLSAISEDQFDEMVYEEVEICTEQ